LVEGIVSEEGLQFHWMAGAHAYTRTFFVDSGLAGKPGKRERHRLGGVSRCRTPGSPRTALSVPVD
jgi:hypothetical protein